MRCFSSQYRRQNEAFVMSEQPANPTGENVTSAVDDAVELVPIKILPEEKKSDIRTKVWRYLDKNDLKALFPPYHKISNFKGAEVAGDLVATLDVFKNAKCIKVDPDKPLQQVRYVTLKAGKTLYVPTPRQRTGLLSKITPPADCDDETLVKCSTRQGVRDDLSVSIELDESIHIDLVVVGCVAVSPKGWRIGKGLGFSDLEYAMLVSVGAIDPTVPVITIVHDCQVIDLPDTLFDKHDVAVDFIVTPTRVIQCHGAPSRPSGIYWSLLNTERLERMRILKRLRYREWKAGKDVRLSGETENPAELTDEIPTADDDYRGPRRMNNRRRPRKTRLTDGEGNIEADDERKDGVSRPVRRGRGGFRGRGRRRPPPRRDDDNRRTSENERDGESERDEDQGRDDRQPMRRGTGRRFVVRRRRFRRSENGGDHREGGGRSEEDEGRESDRHDEEHIAQGSQRRRGRRSDSDGGAPVEGDGRRGGSGGRRFYRPMGRRPYYGDCEGSVYVGALPRSLRVSEFKAEVRDRNVQPLRVIWRGSSGYAFLGFRTMDEAESALEALDGLHISEQNLRLEMAKSSSGRRRRRGGGAPRSADGAGDNHMGSDDEE